MKRILVGLALALPVWGASVPSAFCAPAQIIIIRHGEKPATGNELNEQGFQRAQALVGFFKSSPLVTQYGTPAAIYAMAPKDASGSLRPIETVTPLAQALGLTLHKDYTKEQLQPLVDEIMGNPAYAGHMVLICWEHKIIPEMVKTFGYDLAPQQWPDDDFYSAWILNVSGGKVGGFRAISEAVMPGDPSN